MLCREGLWSTLVDLGGSSEGGGDLGLKPGYLIPKQRAGQTSPCRACIEHLFGHLWHWGLVRNIWCGSPDDLHQSMCVLLHFMQFCIRMEVHHPPFGPWDHDPPHVWIDKSDSAAMQDEGEDEAYACAMCCQKHCTITVLRMEGLRSTLVYLGGFFRGR